MEKKMSIDYTKLNNQIVKQAYNSFALTEEQKQKLVNNKVERAAAMLKARETETVYLQIED